jgi:transposase
MPAAMREMSVAGQRYQAVLDVIGQGRAVMEVATQWGVSRRTAERWLARYPHGENPVTYANHDRQGVFGERFGEIGRIKAKDQVLR